MDNKEKLEEAKRLYETANADQKYVLESLFPELKESEDVRIKKALIDELKIENSNYKLFKDIPKERFIAWLEKQGEQKSIVDDKEIWDNAKKVFDSYNMQSAYVSGFKEAIKL